MFLGRLVISNRFGTIRDIEFHEGLNLIIDETPSDIDVATGNNVGKTTVLKIIDYCLDGHAREIYTDSENRKTKYRLVEDFLLETDVRIKLELVDRIGDSYGKKLVIERDFKKGRNAIRRINGEQIPAGEFGKELGYELFPTLPENGKPTFRQVIAHNIRYKDRSIENTFKFLHPQTRNVEYEDLYLYMLGCPHPDAGVKQNLNVQIKSQKRFLEKLRNGRSDNDYRSALTLIEGKIDRLEKRRRDYEDDAELDDLLAELADESSKLGAAAARLNEINLRISVVERSLEELRESAASIDMDSLELLYREASSFIPQLHASFQDLVEYHNSMLRERIRFIESGLPELLAKRDEAQEAYESTSARHASIASEIDKKMGVEDYESFLIEINKLYEEKGSYERLIGQLESAAQELNRYISQLDEIEENARECGFEERLQRQIDRFNEHYVSISEKLYGESFLLAYERERTKEGVSYIDLHTINAENISAGKKQGEILCFDIAYTEFAEQCKIDHLDFLLNDKKELMHGNQLAQLDRVAKSAGVQIVVPILADKLPEELDNPEYVILRLSQEDKLFRIESSL